MQTYVVEWKMEVDAETPEEAARKAFKYMQTPGTTANRFDVLDEEGESFRVDLMELDEIEVSA